MNTHLLSEVAKVCTTIGVLNHGALIYKDTIEETLERFPNEAEPRGHLRPSWTGRRQ